MRGVDGGEEDESGRRESGKTGVEGDGLIN